MIKSYIAKNSAEVPQETDMELINKYTLRPMDSDELFTFSVILCDNEVDRDFERFSADALKSLEKLFVGKTGILNHSMKSEDQSARTYKTELICDTERKNSLGEVYMYLKAWCYTVRSDKNADLIKDIESGIKKEVSISCSSGRRVCSVCGGDRCSHSAGKEYEGKTCIKSIEDITDAYEWSFVAVPAQKNAGVTKTFKKEINMENILKSLKTENDVVLKSDEAKRLSGYIEALEKSGADGQKYRQMLTLKLKKHFAVVLPALDSECIDELSDNMNSEHLEKLCEALTKQAAQTVPPVSQLYRAPADKQDKTNQQFKF